MAKLIIKQSTSKRLTALKMAVVAALSLILMVMATLAWFKPYQEQSNLLLSAADPVTQTKYHTSYTALKRLIEGFNQQFSQKQGSKTYHERAIAQADLILEQLNQLDQIVEQAQLPKEVSKTLSGVHQYQRDYWDAQRHFQLLRLDRFAEDALLVSHQARGDVPLVTEKSAEPVKKFQFATPPAGVALPAAFCVPGAGTCPVQ